MSIEAQSFSERYPVLYSQLLDCTGASGIVSTQKVQALWSGYGEIIRCQLRHEHKQQHDAPRSAIIKYVQPPTNSTHPRGWNTNTSHERKLASYRVETNWYRHYAKDTRAACAMPSLYASHTDQQATWLIMEDLDGDYPLRHSSLSADQCTPCLHWLARFHAVNLQSAGDGLWPIGTYWHLATRQDELDAMPDSELKRAAVHLDNKLNGCEFMTLVHGDAKLANVCFSTTAQDVALVDFQYVGRGCGIRDVAYFIGSCLNEADCSRYSQSLLDIYFNELTKHVKPAVREPLEQEWRAMYPTAWADFHRFLAGWMPEHQKIHRYTKAMTQLAIAQLA